MTSMGAFFAHAAWSDNIEPFVGFNSENEILFEEIEEDTVQLENEAEWGDEEESKLNQLELQVKEWHYQMKDIEQ